MKSLTRPRIKRSDYLLSHLLGRRLYKKYQERTMIPRAAYGDNIAIAKVYSAIDSLTSGAIVECGTWRGGMAGGLIEACGKERRYYFFDSFEGLPTPTQKDGAKAFGWQQNTEAPDYYDNCAATLEDFMKTIKMTSIDAENVVVKKGWFEDTLSEADVPPIAVLRLDGDWYESTMTCLKALWPKVMEGGIAIIDDYYYWPGCAQAVHEYLSACTDQPRIHQTPLGRVAFIRKETTKPLMEPRVPR